MAEIGLQRSGIDALVGQCVAAGMPEHVWMDPKPILASSPARASSLAKPEGVNGPPRSEAKIRARPTGA
jgi:hypothetical protein